MQWIARLDWLDLAFWRIPQDSRVALCVALMVQHKSVR